MAKRESATGSTKRDPRVTPQSIAAGKANLTKGREKKAAEIKAAKEKQTPTASERWAMLLDGTLTVRDLDDDEIQKMTVRGADGGFSGRRRPLPSHLAQQFRAEAIRRAKDLITAGIPTAARELMRIINDPEAKDSDKLKALSIILDRGMGKTPETVRIESGDDPWSETLRRVFVERDVADAAGEAINRDADA